MRIFRFAMGFFFVVAAGLSSFAETAAADPQKEEQARQIVAHWLEVLGGAWHFREMKSIYYDCTVNFGGDAGPIPLQVRANRLGHYRYDYDLPGFGKLTQAYDGQSVWQKNEQLGFGPLAWGDHQQNLAGVDFRAPLRSWSRYTYRQRFPDETIDGKVLQVVAMGAADQPLEKWYFDAKTGFRVRMEVAVEPGPLVITFSDFRRVPGGPIEPFKIVRAQGDRKMEVTFQAIIHNDDVDEALFAVPASWAEDNQKVEDLLSRNRMQSGIARLDKVETRVTKAMVEVTTSGSMIPTTTFQKRPNYCLIQQEAPGIGTSLQGFDGKIGWAWNEVEGFRTMQGPELQQMLGNANFDTASQLGQLCPLRKILESVQEGERTLHGVAFASLQGVAGNFYYDARTFDLVRLETFIATGANGQMKITAEFSDFRRVDGIMIPFVTVVTNPALRMVTRVESVRHNEPLELSLFEPKKEW